VEDDVIPAAGHGHQVRLQRKRGSQLTVQDLLQQQPPDGQVGVGEVRFTGAEFLGETVSPAPETTKAARLRVPHSFRV